jgi:hypothetical protein
MPKTKAGGSFVPPGSPERALDGNTVPDADEVTVAFSPPPGLLELLIDRDNEMTKVGYVGRPPQESKGEDESLPGSPDLSGQAEDEPTRELPRQKAAGLSLQPGWPLGNDNTAELEAMLRPRRMARWFAVGVACLVVVAGLLLLQALAS